MMRLPAAPHHRVLAAGPALWWRKIGVWKVLLSLAMPSLHRFSTFATGSPLFATRKIADKPGGAMAALRLLMEAPLSLVLSHYKRGPRFSSVCVLWSKKPDKA